MSPAIASLQWRKVSFYRDLGSVAGCMERPGAVRWGGVVIEAEEAAPVAGIPNALVSVRGASGRIVKVNAVEQYLQVVD